MFFAARSKNTPKSASGNRRFWFSEHNYKVGLFLHNKAGMFIWFTSVLIAPSTQVFYFCAEQNKISFDNNNNNGGPDPGRIVAKTMPMPGVFGINPQIPRNLALSRTQFPVFRSLHSMGNKNYRSPRPINAGGVFRETLIPESWNRGLKNCSHAILLLGTRWFIHV